MRTKARPWLESKKDTAAEEPFLISAIDDLELKLHAADALLAVASDIAPASDAR